MQSKIIDVIVGAKAINYLIVLFLGLSKASTASIYTSISFLSPTTPLHFLLISLDLTQLVSSINPTILAALIGLVGIVLGGIIAGAVAIFQNRRITRIEQQKFEYQRQIEQQRLQSEQERLWFERQSQEKQQRFEQRRQAEQYQQNQQLELYRKALEAEIKTKEQKEQNEASKAEVLRLKILTARTNEERVKAYCQALHADPRISRLQILDMGRPLEVANVYVRLRVHEDARPRYILDQEIHSAETWHDPNDFFQARLKHLERRTSNSIDPEEAIRSYKHCVIVGDPGAGKTTLLKYLTLKSADNKLDKLPDLPIHIELNAFASSKCNYLLEFAAEVWEERYGFPKADAQVYMNERLKSGSALMLLDALDETVIGGSAEAAEKSYQHVANAIDQIRTRYYLSPIVVTVRKAGYQQRAPLKGFTELEVLDYRPEEIQQFVTNWFDSSGDPQKHAKAIELNTKLEHNPRIQALAANPLLLSLIVIAYERQLDLPDRRAELYRLCVDTLLMEWDAKRNILRYREFKPEHKRQLLEEIAWHFHIQGKLYFAERDVLQVIAEFLPKIRLLPEQNVQVLAEITNEHGLLKEQARGWHGFMHLTLQDYFVAQYVINNQQLETLLSHLGSPWWEEILLLYAGLTSDASKLLQKLLEHEGETELSQDLFQTNIILAGRCLAAHPTIGEVSLWKTVIVQLFNALTLTPYSMTQELIASALAAIGGQEVNRQLLQLLSNPQIDQNVRRHIAVGLGLSRESSVAPELMQLLSNKQIDASVRECIAEALGYLGERSVVPELVQLLSNQWIKERDMREHVAEGLGRSGERWVVQLLSNKQIDTSLRGRIARALGNAGERSMAASLMLFLSDEQIDASVRGSIAEAIGNLGERSLAPRLAQLLSNQQINVYVRWPIAEALGTLGEHSVAPGLVQLLSNEQIDASLRERIAVALGNLGESSVVPRLLQLLSNEQIDASVRGSIAEALGNLGERSLAPQLVQLLSNKWINVAVHWSIAEALGRLGDRSVVPDLELLLTNRQVDVSVRWRIAVSLNNLGEKKYAFQLVQLLSNEQFDTSVRESIAEALGHTGEPSVAPMLLKLLSNEQINLSLRERIVEALSNLGEQSVAPMLVKLLSNEQLNVNLGWRIVDTLSHLGNHSIMQSLVELSSNEQIDPSVRWSISLCLNKLREYPSNTKYQHVDKNTPWRKLEDIGRAGDQSVIPELIQFLSNDQIDQDERRRIAITLGTLVYDQSSVQSLVILLQTSDIADDIHRALWTISRRIGIRIYITEGLAGKQARIVKL